MLRTFAKNYSERHKFRLEVPYNRPVPVLKVTSSDFEGRKVNSSQFSVDDPSTRYKGLCATDFALENQHAVGFEGKPVFYEMSSSALDAQLESVSRRVASRKQSESSKK